MSRTYSRKARRFYLIVVVSYVALMAYSLGSSLSLPYTGEPYYQQEGEVYE